MVKVKHSRYRSTAGVIIALVLALLTPVLSISDDAGYAYGRHSKIQLTGTTATVGTYEREGRIKRMYGEAFSHGASPVESADNFLNANVHLLGVNAGDLRESSVQPIMYIRETGEYKFTGVKYAQYRFNIPVFRAQIILLSRNAENYPIVMASVDLRKLGDFDPRAVLNRLDPDQVITAAQKYMPSLVNFAVPELVIWAGADDMAVDPILAYSFVGDNGYAPGDSNPEKYLFVIDAITGEILFEEDQIIFVDVIGSVQGNATQSIAADFCEEELPEALPWARVNIDATVAYTDENGDFLIPNGGTNDVTVESRLWGTWFRVWNEAGANSELFMTVTPPGPADFLHNEPNTDEFYRGEVNGYLQANIVRDFTLNYNPSYPGLTQNEFPVYVNAVGGYCPGNAWYDGTSITFCRAGSGYPNTAWSTVVHHEYGHHLVAMAGSGQGAYGEGMGDVMGVLITDDPGTGWGFFGNCDSPLRNADNSMQYPCSGEIHYCGQLISGCVWSTRNELRVTNPTIYRDIISNLAINAMLLHSGSGIDPSITIDYLTLDDDNGNIYDGTPHYEEIAAGFGAHNMDAPELALLSFDFPDGLPDIIFPEGGTTIRVVVSSVTQDPEPGTGMLLLDDGTGWVGISMTVVEPNVYDAVFPAIECGNSVSYVFSAETTKGQTQFWPMGAPEEFYITVSALSFEVVIADDFNSDLGWSVENDPGLTTGAWERGVPVGGGTRGDPPTDYDGSGSCYLTENRSGDFDIDGGITWLISPTLDLSSGVEAQVDYALWYTNDYGNDPHNDLFHTYVSNDNGSNWVLAETIGPVSSAGWKEHSFMVSDFVTLTDQVKVRLEASDLNDPSVVEAGVDAFGVTLFYCALPDVSIDIIPDNPPVIVPPGGSFTYTAILTNNSADNPQTTDVWIMVGVPAGQERGPIELYNNIGLDPSQVLQVDNILQNIPGTLPAGTYEYIAYTGFYPDVIVDRSSFDVTVTSLSTTSVESD